MSILVFRRGGLAIGTVLILIYRAAGEMWVGEKKWVMLPPPLLFIGRMVEFSQPTQDHKIPQSTLKSPDLKLGYFFT